MAQPPRPLVWEELQIQTEDLRQAHQRAQRALERYRALFQDAPVCHIVLQADGIVVEVHGEDIADLGSQANQPFRTRVHPDDASLFDVHLQAVFRNQDHTSCRLRVRDEAGEYHRVKLDSAPIPGDSHATPACRTVLSRAAPAEAVDPQLEQATALLDHTEGVLQVAPSGTVQWASRTARALFHATVTNDSDGLTQRTLVDLFEGAAVAELTATVARGGEITPPLRLLALRLDNTSFPAEVRLISQDSLARGSLLVLQDRSVEQHLQEELHRSQRLEALGRFAANVMLEVQNVLSGVHAATEVSLEHLGNRNAARPPMKMIRQATGSALELARLVLSMEHRRAEKLQPMVLDERITEMRPLLDRLAGDRIDLNLDLAAADQAVRVEQGAVVQLLVNLVTNACDAMPEGGKVSLATHTTEPSRSRKGESVILEISDTGEGIDHTELDRIFEPYFTTNGDPSRRGLGLSTVKNLVERSGGTITASSEPGGGTRFRITLPCWHNEQVQPPAPAPAPAEPACTECSILVVEEPPLSLLGIEHGLRQAGHRVIAVSNLRDAKWALRLVGPELDAAVVDLDDTDGVVDEIRSSAPQAQVLYVTGDPAEADRPGVFLRPVDTALLMRDLRSATAQNPEPEPSSDGS